MGAPPQQIQVNDLDRQQSILLDVTDGLYKREYIDNNIDHVVSDFDQEAMDRITMTVFYDNGGQFVVPLGNVPVIYRVYVNGQWYTQVQGNATLADVDHYVRRNHLIYPVDAKENVIFSNWLTPNIVDLRSKIYNYVQQASQLLEIAELVYAFNGDIAALGSFGAHLNSFKLTRVQKPPNPSWSEGQPVRRPVGLPIVWDDDAKEYVLSPRERSKDPGKAPASPPPPPPPSGGGGSGITYRDSLQRIRNWLRDPGAFSNGRPVFKSIGEFDQYWRQQKFVLVKNDPFGPPGGRQLIYRGPDNTVVKIKTMGYEGGPRMGRATMSLEITDGDGENWANTLCKVDAQGEIIAKNLHNFGAEVVELPPDHADAKTHSYGIRNPKTGKVMPLTKFEVLQGGQGPQADQQAWADRGHLDLPDGFSGAGADDLK